jgi:MFS family permease
VILLVSSISTKDISVEEKLKSKTMQMSIAEGSFGVFSSILSDNYIIPFALSLNSSPFQIGILSSAGNLISPIGQVIGSRRIESNSRKSVLLSGILGQASGWPLFFLIILLFQLNFFRSLIPWILIGIFLFYMLFAGIMTPPWFSVMGDVVPENYRGRYFAKRNLITNLIALTGAILLSYSLDWFTSQGKAFFGFTLIFIFGFFTRLLSAFLFTKHYYPAFNFEIADRVRITQFLKEIPKSNFGKFTLFVALLTLGQWIAGPFFSVYMLEELKFDYSIFIIINLSSSFVALFIFPFLGRISDKFGNVKLLRMGAIIIPILPLLWLFFNNPISLILGPQLLSGIGWTAFNLATSNFIYDNISPKKRGKYIALYNLLIGLAIISGGLIGSCIISFIPIHFMNRYLFLFLISGIVRIIVVIGLLYKIKEVRVSTKPILNVKNLSIYKWLYDLTVRNNHSEKKQKKEKNTIN